MLDANPLQHQIAAAMANNDWATVAQLEPQLDAVQPQPNRPSLLQSALWYSAQGLHVFPLQPGLKIPHPGTRGCKDATTDGTQIRRWWKQWPDSNLAIATGHLIDVIDIDGKIGVRSLARSVALPPILGVVATPRLDKKTGQRGGGWHLYIPADSDNTNKANIAPGVDIRGTGGYVCAPPSIHPDTGRRYQWRRPLTLTQPHPTFFAGELQPDDKPMGCYNRCGNQTATGLCDTCHAQAEADDAAWRNHLKVTA